MPPLSAGRTSRWTLPHEGVDEQAHPEGEGDGPRQVETATVSGRLAASSCGRRPGRHRRHTDVDRVERPQPLHPLAYSPDDQIDVGIVQDDQARLAGVGSGPTGTTQPWRATRCGSRSWWRCPEAGGTSTSGTRNAPSSCSTAGWSARSRSRPTTASSPARPPPPQDPAQVLRRWLESAPARWGQFELTRPQPRRAGAARRSHLSGDPGPGPGRRRAARPRRGQRARTEADLRRGRRPDIRRRAPARGPARPPRRRDRAVLHRLQRARGQPHAQARRTARRQAGAAPPRPAAGQAIDPRPTSSSTTT